MTKSFNFGSAFGTHLNIHVSWLWIAPLIVYTLVTLNLEPLTEAIITTLLIFASVLLTSLARIWFAQSNQVGWHAATLFLLGTVIERDQRSSTSQSIQIESAGIAMSTLLAIVFGAFWFVLPSGPLGIEMEIVALFNVLLLALALFTRFSPVHDNLLHAALTMWLPNPWSNTIMTLLHSILLMIFAGASVFMLGVGWLAFGWWFALALMLSHIVDSAESQGEYRTEWTYATAAQPTENLTQTAEKIV